jgi:hypothetical protein
MQDATSAIGMDGFGVVGSEAEGAKRRRSSPFPNGGATGRFCSACKCAEQPLSGIPMLADGNRAAMIGFGHFFSQSHRATEPRSHRATERNSGNMDERFKGRHRSPCLRVSVRESVRERIGIGTQGHTYPPIGRADHAALLKAGRLTPLCLKGWVGIVTRRIQSPGFIAFGPTC